MNIKMLFIVLGLAFLVTACKKDYFIDTGIHEAKYDGTILQYLKDKPGYFDSLTRIIKIAGMEEVFTKDTITFFAPPDITIMSSVEALNQYLYSRGKDTVKRLDQISPLLWKEMLSLYIIKDKYLLKDIPQIDTTQLQAFGGQGFISYGGRPMNVGLIYNDAGGVKYAGYRQMCYSYILQFNNSTGSMVNVLVASSDIQPTNGVIHALRFYNHNFGFISSKFILAAIGYGISG